MVNGLCRKLSDVDFLEYVNDFDILLLSETWIGSKNYSVQKYFFVNTYSETKLLVQLRVAAVAAFQYMLKII